MSEDFNYAATTQLVGGTELTPWLEQLAGASTLKAESPGLIYAGYPGSGIGVSAGLIVNGQDIYYPIESTSTTLYYSFLVTSTVPGSSGYFIHLGSSSTNFAGRVFIKASSTAGKMNFGLSNTSTGTYATTPTDFDITPTDFSTTYTYLVIVKYNPENGDASLWVKSAGIPLTEVDAGTPEVTVTGSAQTPIQKLNLRQYSATHKIWVDGIRVSKTWADLFETATLDWCNLQHPGTQTINIGNSFDVYAQAYEASVTNGVGQTTDLNAWIGVSTVNTNPNTWVPSSWIPAIFNVDNGNNDEFKASIGSTLAAGTYYYASRFQYNGGPFTYGGYVQDAGGFWDATTNISGVLTVVEPPSVTSVTVTPETATVAPGGTQQLTATVVVVGGAAQTVNWTTSDLGGKVTVDGTGLVSVAADATFADYVITATSTVDNTKSDISTITVSAPSVTSVTVTPETATVAPGGTQQLTATVVAVGGAAQTINWTTSDGTGKVTVDGTGLVSVAADAPLTNYTITATSTFDGTKSDFSTITVSAPSVTSVTVTPETATVVQGGTQQLTATVVAIGGAAQTVNWTTSDLSGKVTVSATGLVSVAADAPLTNYTITATSTFDGTKSDFSTITVSSIPTASLPYTQNFTTCPATDWTIVNVDGNSATWICGISSEVGTMYANGYNATPAGSISNDWLISPAFNLNATANEILTFETKTQFTGPAITVKYSTNYIGSGDPTLATWTDLPSYTLATTTTFTSSGNINVSAINGNTVFFAFVYTSTGTASNTAANWWVDNFVIKEPIPAITITAPTGLTNLTSTSVDVTYTVENAPGGVVYKYVLNSNAEVALPASPFTITAIEGSNTIVLKMFQADGTTLVTSDEVIFNVVLPTAPTKIVITSVTPASPYVNSLFNLTVQAQDNSNNPQNVTGNQSITLSENGTGTLATNLTANILDGQNSVTFTGLTYDVVETITITATSTNLGTATKEVIILAQPTVPMVFISEYIEGSSNNKAIEIYNGTSGSINLDNYRIAYASGGAGWSLWHTFPVGTTVANGEVWVIAADAANALILAQADQALAYPSVCHYNGDDAVALEFTSDGGTTWNIIDLFGNPTTDPGTAWAVAGTPDATANHTLVRKYPHVTVGTTDWALSAGTDAATSQWIVNAQDDFTFIGWHGTQVLDPAITITSPDGLTNLPSTAVDVTYTVENVPVNAVYKYFLNADVTGVSFTSSPISITAVVGSNTIVLKMFEANGTTLITSDEVTFNVVLPAAPTKIVVTNVTPASPYINTTFAITVQAQDANNNPQNVSVDEIITLSETSTNGVLTGTLTGTILAGTNSVTFTGLSYNFVENLTITATSTTLSTANTSVNFQLLQSIAYARSQAVNSTVTVMGVVLNGAELGSIRYMQDLTGGIAAYGTSLAAVQRGDIILVTGTLVDYKQLLEINPITSVQVISSGNPMPTAQIITPSQVGESYESELVSIEDASFSVTGNFEANTNYVITSGGQTIDLRVVTTCPLVGTAIPTGVFDLTAITSQYHSTDPLLGYQLLVRDANDLVVNTVDPYLTITSPDNDATIGVDNVNVVYTVGNFTVGTDGSVKYSINGGATQSSVSSPIALTGLANDTYTVDVWLVDMSGNPLTPAVDASVTFTIDVIDGIKGLENVCSVYPNPSNSILNISANSTINKIQIMDIVGKTVYSSNQTSESVKVDVSSFTDGIYILNISTKNGNIIEKFIKN